MALDIRCERAQAGDGQNRGEDDQQDGEWEMSVIKLTKAEDALLIRLYEAGGRVKRAHMSPAEVRHMKKLVELGLAEPTDEDTLQ